MSTTTDERRTKLEGLIGFTRRQIERLSARRKDIESMIVGLTERIDRTGPKDTTDDRRDRATYQRLASENDTQVESLRAKVKAYEMELNRINQAPGNRA